jgi:hypothetical protein
MGFASEASEQRALLVKDSSSGFLPAVPRVLFPAATWNTAI